MAGRLSPSRAALGALAIAFPIVGIALAAGPRDFGIGGPAVLALGMLGYHVLPFFIRPPKEAREGDERTWTLGARNNVGLGARLLGTAMWALIAAFSRPGEQSATLFFAFLIGIGCVPVLFPDLRGRVFAERAATRAVTVDPRFVSIRFPAEEKTLRHADITGVEQDGKFVVIRTAEERHVVDARDIARAISITEAIRTARAKDAERRRAAADAGPTILERPTGVPLREWLARLDAAAAVAHAAGTYRGGEGIDPEALWATLEDAGRDAHTRAAAARLLARSPDDSVRTRVHVATKAIEDEGVRVRVAAALDPDAERAAEALEEIEAVEMKRVLSRD